jgi:hypothetical protein
MNQDVAQINQWFSAQEMDLTECKFKYLKDDQEVELDFDTVLQATLDRISAPRLLEIFNKINHYFHHDWWDRKNSDPSLAALSEISRFLQDMANYKVFENYRFFTWEQLAQDFSMDQEFLKWWMTEQNLNEQQMLCDHDDSDQFAEDGVWYNSVGTCIRCRVRMDKTVDQSESVDLVYKAWQKK